jgi:DNA repair exonuclease SbcCD ATPase subunit
MRLISAEFINFCQHRDSKVTFAPGLTAVLGRNGSGKSNLMKGIYAAISGDFGRNDGLKTDNINQFASITEPSRIVVNLEHAGANIQIIRGLRPVSTRLRISSSGVRDIVITKTQEASDTLTNLLGISSRMLSDYVFVDQWSIFDFLSMMPAERAKAFQRLFRTEKAEALWKTLGEHYDNIVIKESGIDKDALNKRLADNTHKQEEVQKRLDVINARLAQCDVKKDRALVECYVSKKSKTEKLSNLEVTRLEILKEHSTEIATLRELSCKSSVLGTSLKSREAEYNETRNSLAVYSTNIKMLEAKNNLDKQLEALKANLPTLPTSPVDYIDTTEASNTFMIRLAELKSRVDTSAYFIGLLKDEHNSCPTCGTPRCTFENHKDEYLKGYEQDRNSLIEMNDIYARSMCYEQELMSYKSKVNYYNKQVNEINSIKNNLAAIKTVSTSGKDYSELQLFMTAYEEDLTKFEEMKAPLVKLETTIAQRTKTISQLAIDIAVLKGELDNAETLTEAAFKQAEERLAKYNDQLSKRAEYEGELRGVCSIIAADKQSLAEIVQAENILNAERTWSERVLDFRQVLHRDSLPRIVAQNYLDLMHDEINLLLTRFDSPFTITTDDTLSFIATFKDGRRVQAARLSGGEKVLLALAFRVVVNDIFAKDLGLLCLDEPTAGLDDGNIGCLKTAVERLKELSSTRGLQVIMVTHEKELSYLFDHVIEVGT